MALGRKRIVNDLYQRQTQFFLIFLHSWLYCILYASRILLKFSSVESIQGPCYDFQVSAPWIYSEIKYNTTSGKYRRQTRNLRFVTHTTPSRNYQPVTKNWFCLAYSGQKRYESSSCQFISELEWHEINCIFFMFSCVLSPPNNSYCCRRHIPE